MSKIKFLLRFLPFENNMPSHDRLGLIFGAFDAQTFQACFIAWTPTSFVQHRVQGFATKLDGCHIDHHSDLQWFAQKGYSPSAPSNSSIYRHFLTTGVLSKDSNFRLIVSGPVGVKEIERLIAKLGLDKEILAEPDQDEDRGEQ